MLHMVIGQFTEANLVDHPRSTQVLAIGRGAIDSKWHCEGIRGRRSAHFSNREIWMKETSAAGAVFSSNARFGKSSSGLS